MNTTAIENYCNKFSVTPMVYPCECVEMLDDADLETIKAKGKETGHQLAEAIKSGHADVLVGAFVQSGYCSNLNHWSAYLAEICEMKRSDVSFITLAKILKDDKFARGFCRMNRMLLHMRTVIENILTDLNSVQLYKNACAVLSHSVDEMIGNAFVSIQLFITWCAYRGGTPETYRKYDQTGGFKLIQKTQKRINKSTLDEYVLSLAWSAASVLYEVTKRIEAERPELTQAPTMKKEPTEPQQMPKQRKLKRYREAENDVPQIRKDRFVRVKNIGLVAVPQHAIVFPDVEPEQNKVRFETVYSDTGFNDNPFANFKRA